MKLVLIQWEDAFAHSVDWVPHDSVTEAIPIKCITCGVLSRETDDFVTVHLSHNAHNYSQALTIPKGCIKKMWQLKVIKK